MLGFEPVLIASKTCCPTHWAMKNMPNIPDFTRDIKVYGKADIRTRTYCLKNFSSNLTTKTLYLIRKEGSQNTLKKKRNDRTD